jgi:hypothetical protein
MDKFFTNDGVNQFHYEELLWTLDAKLILYLPSTAFICRVCPNAAKQAWI